MKRNKFFSSLYVCLALFSVTAFAQSPIWSVNPNEYQYSMTITAILNMDGKIANESADKVAAFVNGECRGVGTASTATASGSKLAFLQIYSNAISGENITFKMYDASQNMAFDAINMLSFQSDAAFGSISDPYLITTNNNPTAVSLSSTSIIEDASKNSTVGIFSTIDADTGSVFTYSFLDSIPNDNQSFLIEGDKLKSNTVFDYDLKTSYTIYVLVEDGKGGILKKKIEVMVTPSENKFEAGNYISPNGDGINDVWEIDNVYLYTNYETTIFNSSGQTVLKTTDYKNDWKGTYNGSALPSGVYYYVLKNEKNKFTGSITLVHD